MLDLKLCVYFWRLWFICLLVVELLNFVWILITPNSAIVSFHDTRQVKGDLSQEMPCPRTYCQCRSIWTYPCQIISDLVDRPVPVLALCVFCMRVFEQWWRIFCMVFQGIRCSLLAQLSNFFQYVSVFRRPTWTLFILDTASLLKLLYSNLNGR